MNKWLKYEPWLFAILVLAGTMPILLNRYFVTLDGPAHLYNAILIRELLTGDHQEIHNLFVLNDFPVPNWSGHFLMAMFSMVLPAWMAEKIVFLACFTLLPLFFRKLVLHLYPGNTLLTYPIILFAHNQLLYFGFLNMSLGILFMIMTAWLFVRYLNQLTWKNVLIISLLLLMIWFSHIMVFMITLGVLVVLVLITIPRKEEGNGSLTFSLTGTGRKILLIAIAAIPAILLSVLYFIRIDSLEPSNKLPLPELLRWIVDVRPLLALAYNSKWTPWTNLLFLWFMMAMAGSIWLWFRNHGPFRGKNLMRGFSLNISGLWMLVWMAFLLLFLVLPNSILLTERLIYLFYLFFILWLASLKVPRSIALAGVVVVMLVHGILTGLYLKTVPPLSENATALEKAGKKIENNSLVLTLNYSDHWMFRHISGYLGISDPVAMLNNYEADLVWFPVQWNPKIYQTRTMHNWGIRNLNTAQEFFLNASDTTCFSIPAIGGNLVPIRYVLVIDGARGKDNISHQKAAQMLEEHYAKVDSESFFDLYRLK
ncbi:MAG TPA: hypothetical protein P5228_09105 [Bacteroidales bacterium]|nr:hypothetical protein [Bacteroidales bacterium]HRZ49849.1 hypothetical protein [Bacteroidales bacterium]